jgi:hypothetical protein
VQLKPGVGTITDQCAGQHHSYMIVMYWQDWWIQHLGVVYPTESLSKFADIVAICVQIRVF